MKTTVTAQDMITALKAQGMSDALIDATLKALASKGGARKQPRECRCGCGGMTKGGIYQPGHDAKHLSATLHALREGVTMAPAAPAKAPKAPRAPKAPKVTEITEQVA